MARLYANETHTAHPDHAGIIVCTFDPDFRSQAVRIHEAIVSAGSLDGKLLRVNRPGPEPSGVG